MCGSMNVKGFVSLKTSIQSVAAALWVLQTYACLLAYFLSFLQTHDALKRSLKLAPLTPCVEHTWVLVKNHAISNFNHGA